MSNPRIEVNLDKIRQNTRTVVGLLKERGIRVTGVTKAVCGHPAIAQAMLDGGTEGLAETRLSNVKRLRQAGISCLVTLIRTPMLSQVDDVVQVCEASYNTEIAVIAALAAAAIRKNRVHDIILMVEMGDLREGIMPQDLCHIAQKVVKMSGVVLKGIGANFACLGGTAPDVTNMHHLSALARDVEGHCGSCLQVVSGGNSANLPWALEEHAAGRINDLRLGEAILLGVDPVSGDQIDGMFLDAFTLVAEVIETDASSARPVFTSADATLARARFIPNTSETTRLILAVGHQDTDATGLSMPSGNILIGATSDHLVVGTKDATLCVGSKMRFQMNYVALMRAMAAPDIQTYKCYDRHAPNAREAHSPSKHLVLD